MSRVLLLTKVLFKSIGQDSKKASRFLVYAIVIVLGLFPLASMVVGLSVMVFNNLKGLGQEAFIIGLFTNVGMLMTFMFAFFTIPALYYYGNDIESILPLPFKAWEIIMAKFITALIFEYAVVAIIFVPMLIGYGMVFGVSVSLIVGGIVGAMLFPIIPVIYASIVVMLIMRFSKLFANKERFGLIAGLIGIMFAIGINVVPNMLASQDPNALIDIINQNKSLLSTLGTIFPMAIFLPKLIEGQWVYLVLIILLHVIAIAIMIIISQKIYFAGVLNVSGSNSRKQKLSNEQLVSKSQRVSVLKSIMVKEFRDMTRSSIYFMNLIIISYIFPVLLIVPFFVSGETGVIISFVSAIDFNQSWIINGTIVICFAAGIFFAGMSNIASTSIKREGSNFFVMKMIPVPYETQLLGKMLPGIIVGGSAAILCFVVMGVVAKIPVFIILIGCVYAMLGVSTISMINLWIGCINPRLDWTTEAQAVKQSVIALVGILLSMVLAGVTLALLFLVNQPVYLIAPLVVVIACVFGFVGWKMANRSFIQFADKY